MWVTNASRGGDRKLTLAGSHAQQEDHQGPQRLRHAHGSENDNYNIKNKTNNHNNNNQANDNKKTTQKLVSMLDFEKRTFSTVNCFPN